MKANPTTKDQFKSNKLAIHKEYNNKVNESEIHSSSLDQVQQLTNEDKDVVFDALVAAEIECTIFQLFGNNNLDLKIKTLFDTGAMKSVMSWIMYQKLNLNDLDTTSILHVVGASGESYVQEVEPNAKST